MGDVDGSVTLARKLTDQPGEQMLVYRPDGIIDLIADLDAADTEAVRQRDAHPFYATGTPCRGGLCDHCRLALHLTTFRAQRYSDA